MTERVIVDAGPALNFFSINQERVLIHAVGPIAAPESVKSEVERRSRSDRRFARAFGVWAKVEQGGYLKVLSDEITPSLAAAVQRISSLPMAERMRHRKDLGETMVIAHAAVRAEGGADVIVLIDEIEGTRLASAEAARLNRLRTQGRTVGSIAILNTSRVLERAAGSTYLPSRLAMKEIYKRLRACDDGLVEIRQTNLLSAQVWARATASAQPISP